MGNADSVRLVCEQTIPVKQLEGFQRHHRVPTSSGASDQRYICELTAPQIDADMQSVFSALRKSYGFKRKEISVDGPAEGGGFVATPFFCYQIQVQQDDEAPSMVTWIRSITEISEPARVFAGPFDEVFGRQFSELEILTQQPLDLEAIVDHIEDLDSEAIDVDYDKDLTWCELNVLSSTSHVRLNDSCIRLTSRAEVSPQELLESFLDIQKRFIATLSINDVPFLSGTRS